MTQNGPKSQVVTRFAPSPTGLLHGGNYRTAIFCYLFARQNNGKFLLRIEDTDKARSKKEYEENILETLQWLGLEHDAMVRQSDRMEIHKTYLRKLIDEGKAYISKEDVSTPAASANGESTHGKKAVPATEKRSEVIRFKNPNKKVTFKDLVRGEIVFDTTEFGDFIIAKSLEEPVFHLAVVVDDFEMGVTHVIRGEDHISNTTRHILIQEAIGAPTPIYAHLPLVLSPDRTKLSKRKGALPLTAYRDQGYLPEAMINFLVMVGWNPGTDQEILSVEELLKVFKLDKVQKGGAVFNEEKLKWLNKEYVKRLPNEKKQEILLAKVSSLQPELANTMKAAERGLVEKIIPIVFERIEILSDLDKMISAGDLHGYFNDFSPKKEMLVWKNDTPENAKTHLQKVLSILESQDPSKFSKEDIKTAIFPYAEQNGKGNVLWPLRISLLGLEKSPDPFTLIETLGRETSIERIKKAIAVL